MGSKTLEDISLYAFKRGVKVLSLYAFSCDNFKRSEEEVNYLMNLFIKMFKTKLNKIKEKGIKVVFSGRKIPLRNDILDAMQKLMNDTQNNKNGILNICLNYGGQEEIIDASIKIAQDVSENKIKIEDINKELFNKYLYNDLPNIDLLIRTSGELRVSDFMLYQMSYAEFYFTDTLFPDFDEKKFDKALDFYSKRDRRFGDVK